MEKIFGDVFYDFQERPSDRGYLDAYVDLVDLYLQVIQQTTDWLGEDPRRGAPIGRLLAAAASTADDVDVMTFNHDLVIENEIYKRSALRARWCIDQGYGTMAGSLTTLVPTEGGVATFPRHVDGECDHHRPIRILKLHGSLNWFARINSTRPTAQMLNGQRTVEPFLLIRREISPRQVFARTQTGRGRSSWRLWPLVVPPVYAKQALRGSMASAWDDARASLEQAARIIVFGYSLPNADLEAEKMIERAMSRNAEARWVDVVNPSPDSAARFADVCGRKPIRWYPSVESLMETDALSPPR